MHEALKYDSDDMENKMAASTTSAVVLNNVYEKTRATNPFFYNSKKTT